jgi:hypothetical protein
LFRIAVWIARRCASNSGSRSTNRASSPARAAVPRSAPARPVPSRPVRRWCERGS